MDEETKDKLQVILLLDSKCQEPELREIADFFERNWDSIVELVMNWQGYERED